jgi:hypothetical protein
MQWVRLDTGFPRNHKTLALAYTGQHTAIVTYICGLAYSGEQETDGFIPAEALPWVHGTPAAADALVYCGLWDPQPGGWIIHDWDSYQPSTAEMQARSKRAQAAAFTRWDAHKDNPP